MHMVTNSKELIEYFKPKLQYFVRLNFVARWQDQQSRDCLGHFLLDIMVSVIVFVKNYSFEIQNKINLCIGIIINAQYLCICLG
jgi:hypothetical protein